MHGMSPFYRGAKLDGSYKDTRLGSDNGSIQAQTWFPEPTLISTRVCTSQFTVPPPPATCASLSHVGHGEGASLEAGTKGRELVQRWAASRAFACFHTFLNPARVWRSAHSPGRVRERQTYKRQNDVTGTATGLSGARRRGQFRTKRTPLVTRWWQPVLWYNNYMPGLSQA